MYLCLESEYRKQIREELETEIRKELQAEFETKNNRVKEWYERRINWYAEALEEEWDLREQLYGLNNIWINPDKKVVTTKNRKGELIKVPCCEEDNFDPYIGVALAYAYRTFGSKNAFRKMVDKIIPKPKSKIKTEPTQRYVIPQLRYEVHDRVVINDQPESSLIHSLSGQTCFVKKVDMVDENTVHHYIIEDLYDNEYAVYHKEIKGKVIFR